MDPMFAPHSLYANFDATITLFGKYKISGQYANIKAHHKIAKAIETCTYNKPDPHAPPGHWSTWLTEHDVYGEQMQTCFCLTCGEYQYLSYHMSHHYSPARSEPPTCTCSHL